MQECEINCLITHTHWTYSGTSVKDHNLFQEVCFQNVHLLKRFFEALVEGYTIKIKHKNRKEQKKDA